jgi:hypothetical protein
VPNAWLARIHQFSHPTQAYSNLLQLSDWSASALQPPGTFPSSLGGQSIWQGTLFAYDRCRPFSFELAAIGLIAMQTLDLSATGVTSNAASMHFGNVMETESRQVQIPINTVCFRVCSGNQLGWTSWFNKDGSARAMAFAGARRAAHQHSITRWKMSCDRCAHLLFGYSGEPSIFLFASSDYVSAVPDTQYSCCHLAAIGFQDTGPGRRLRCI